MRDTERDQDDTPGTGVRIGRRAFFGRALLAVGATTTLLTLTGCPGGGGEGDDGDGDDGGDDD